MFIPIRIFAIAIVACTTHVFSIQANLFARTVHPEIDTTNSLLPAVGTYLVANYNCAKISIAQNTALRSYDNGGSWTELTPSLKNLGVRCASVNNDTLFVVSMVGTVSYSTNVGLTWVALPLTQKVNAVQTVSEIPFVLLDNGTVATLSTKGLTHLDLNVKDFTSIFSNNTGLFGMVKDGSVYSLIPTVKRLGYKGNGGRKTVCLASERGIVIVEDEKVYLYPFNGTKDSLKLKPLAWSSCNLFGDSLYVAYYRGGLELHVLGSNRSEEYTTNGLEGHTINVVSKIGAELNVGATGKFDGFYRYDSPSDTWVFVPPIMLNDQLEITDIHVRDSLIVVCSKKNGVFTTRPGGKALKPISSGVNGVEVSRVYETDGQLWFNLRSLGLFRLQKCSAELEQVQTPIANGQEFFSTSIDDVVYLFVNDKEAYRSTDLGESWIVFTYPSEGSAMLAVFAGDDDQLMVGTNRGVFVTSDQGDSWSRYTHKAEPFSVEWGFWSSKGLFYSSGNLLFYVAKNEYRKQIVLDPNRIVRNSCYSMSEFNHHFFACVEGGFYTSPVDDLKWTFHAIPSASFIKRVGLIDDKLEILTSDGRLIYTSVKDVLN